MAVTINVAVVCLCLVILLDAKDIQELTIDSVKLIKSADGSTQRGDIKILYDKSENSYNIYTSRVEYLIDMGLNYEITSLKILFDDKSFKINANVGFKKESNVATYSCKFSDGTSTCSPLCGYSTYARFIYLVISRDAENWFRAYKIKVFGKKITDKIDDLAFKRPYLPTNDCSLNAGDIVSDSNKGTPMLKNSPFQVTLDSIYGIKKIAFKSDKAESIEVSLVDDSGKATNFTIQLSSCKSDTDMLTTCYIPTDKQGLSTMAVNVKVPGLSKLKVYGDPIYYPYLKSKKRMDDEKVYLSFTETVCDLSQHTNCDRQGIIYKCDKLVISRSDNATSSIVISEGTKVHSNWDSVSQFTVKSGKEGETILIAPRSYKYMGSYFSKCVLNDAKKTKILSKSITISEDDVNDGLRERTKFEFGLPDATSGKMKYSNLDANIIVLREKSYYFGVRITFYSIVEDVKMVSDRLDELDVDIETTPLGKTSLKAFDSVGVSWSIPMYSYEVIFEPESKQNSIPLKWISKSLKRNYTDRLEVLDLSNSQAKDKLFAWEWLRTPHFVEFRAFTASDNKFTLILSEKSCGKDKKEKGRSELSKDVCNTESKLIRCVNLFNGRALIIRVNNASSTTIYSLAVFDSYNAIVRTIKSESVVESGVAEKLKNINLTPSIESVDFANKDVKLRINIDSKVLMDSVSCGKVTVEITVPDKTKFDAVLTQNFFQLKSVKPTLSSDNFTISLQFKLKVGNSTENSPLFNLTLTNPFKLKATGYEKKAIKTLKFSWAQIPRDVYPAVKGFQVNVLAMIQACQSVHTNDTYTVKKPDVFSPNVNYFSRTWPIPQNYIMEYTVTIRLMLVETNNPDSPDAFYGPAMTDKFVTGAQKQGSIALFGDKQTDSHQVKLTSGQVGLPCSFDSANFTVTMTDKLNFTPNFTRVDDNTYHIGDLMPGRKYEIKATINYKKGSDKPTKTLTFETLDDITVPSSPVIIDEGTSKVVNCSGILGSGKVKKSLEWKLVKRYPLKNGVSFSTNDEGSASLSFPNAKSYQSATYQCFINPSVDGSKPATVDVIVTGVKLNTSRVVASKSGQFSILCTGKKGDKFSDLQWYKKSSDGNLVKVDSGKVEEIPQDDPLVQKKRLTISNVDLKDTGSYSCEQELVKEKFSAGKIVDVVLVEKAEITEDRPSDSSYMVGDVREIKCGGSLAYQDQKPEWQVTQGGALSLRREGGYHILRITSTLDSQKEYNCTIMPPTEDGKLKGTASISHKLVPGVKLHKSAVKVVVGTSFKYVCSAFPSATGQRARWVKPQSSRWLRRRLLGQNSPEYGGGDNGNSSVILSDTAPNAQNKSASSSMSPPTTTEPPPRFQQIDRTSGSTLTSTTPEKSTIHFKEIAYSDAGEYECQLVDTDGQTVVKRTTLNIKVVEPKKSKPAGSQSGGTKSASSGGGGGGGNTSSRISCLTSLVLFSVALSLALTCRRHT